jgi:hypothetical protein
MNILFVILGMNVFIIFIFRRELLTKLKPFLIILFFNLFLFVSSFWLQNHHMGNSKFIPLLKVPLIYQTIFYVMLTIYRMLFHADPVDTLWSADKTKMKDGIFNFVYGVLLAFVVILVY